MPGGMTKNVEICDNCGQFDAKDKMTEVDLGAMDPKAPPAYLCCECSASIDKAVEDIFVKEKT